MLPIAIGMTIRYNKYHNDLSRGWAALIWGIVCAIAVIGIVAVATSDMPDSGMWLGICIAHTAVSFILAIGNLILRTGGDVVSKSYGDAVCKVCGRGYYIQAKYSFPPYCSYRCIPSNEKPRL